MHDQPEEISTLHCASCGASLPEHEDEGLCPSCGAPFGQQTLILPAITREAAEQARASRDDSDDDA